VTEKRRPISVLIEHLVNTDPKLYEALRVLDQQDQTIYNELFPLQNFVRTQTEAQPAPDVAISFAATVGPNYILLTWDSDDPNIRFYELRRGTTWETASFITKTTTLSAVLDPLPAGDYTYLLKTLNSDGVYQSDAAISVAFTVYIPNAPNVSGQVIDNNVLLFWNSPVINSFSIQEFNIYKDGDLVGTQNGTFAAFFEMIAGTYTYEVTAVDLAGNESLAASIDLEVNQPPDFEIEDERLSDFSGTKVDSFEFEGTLIVDVVTTETWEDHFLNNSWDQIQDQIGAGFPYYIQPADSADIASYQETIDYGVALNNIIFNVLTSQVQIAGNTVITCEIEYKVNSGDPWTGPVAGFSVFVTTARYFRVTLTFTSADEESILQVTELKFVADVKQEIDSGQVDALAADGGGTTVAFNKIFKDVKSITTTVGDTTGLIVVVDFTDIPDPTDFKVLVFNSAGVRQDALVYWKARGIT